jgi:uncharacterized membrane protein
MEILTTEAGWYFLARWGHLLFGITWVGLLYYFNFVQTPWLKSVSAGTRTEAFTGLVPRALWWFRWGAVGTVITGLALLGILGRGVSYDIVVGAGLGILMFLNVWLIIWPQQRVLVASQERVAAGETPLPEAEAAAPKAALASRTNTLFSAPMLFFMASSAHYPLGGPAVDASGTSLAAVLLLVTALEANGVFGRPGPLASVRGVVAGSLVLTGVLWALIALL